MSNQNKIELTEGQKDYLNQFFKQKDEDWVGMLADELLDTGISADAILEFIKNEADQRGITLEEFPLLEETIKKAKFEDEFEAGVKERFQKLLKKFLRGEYQKVEDAINQGKISKGTVGYKLVDALLDTQYFPPEEELYTALEEDQSEDQSPS